MSYYYKNGKIAKDRICFDVSEMHWRLGSGFFETLFYNGHQLCHLEKHIERLQNSLQAFSLPGPQVDWELVIKKILTLNRLDKAKSKTNIFYLLGETENTLIITTEAFTPASKPLRLTQFQKPHDSFLAQHKSMSYLPYSLSKMDAKRRGFDDALVIDNQNCILEATRGALVFKENDIFISPTGNVLPSIAKQVAKNIISIQEKRIESRSIKDFKEAYFLNSLQGALPISSIDSASFESDPDICKKLTLAIHETQNLLNIKDLQENVDKHLNT